MQKREIREKMVERRRLVSEAERAEYSHRICKALLDRFCGSSATIAVYLATADEISLDEFIEHAPQSLRLAAPRWDAAAKTYGLALLPHSSDRLRHGVVAGRFGIREPSHEAQEISPAEIDVWLVPGLAFTPDGARLGYGGGYYDRFLANARQNAESIAIAYPFQILASLPVSPHDIAVSRILALDADE